MVIAFFNGAFTLGFSFSWMAIYLVELFTSTVRATAASFVFNGARLIAWIFPIIAGADRHLVRWRRSGGADHEQRFRHRADRALVHAGDDREATAGIVLCGLRKDRNELSRKSRRTANSPASRVSGRRPARPPFVRAGIGPVAL